ncbi:MAG: N-acetyltransferase [bacterium]
MTTYGSPVLPSVRPAAAEPTLRTERGDDATAVRAAVLAAFGPDRGEVAELARRLAAEVPGAGRVTELDGTVVGHVRVSRGWLDAPDRLLEVGVLSPLSVRPEQQGRGIGAALVAGAVRDTAALGWPLLFLEGSPDYYARQGFRTAGPMGFTAPSVRIPAPAFQAVLLPGYDPSMSGALVYPDVFWELDCVGLR